MDKLTKIINEWDPTNLMSHAPDDEYELEIEKIKKALESTDNELELAKSIMSIFLESSGEEFFKKTLDDCILVARKILAGKTL